MLHLLISFDGPEDRLLYGKPDPWLAEFECRNNDGADQNGDGRISLIEQVAYEIQQQGLADPDENHVGGPNRAADGLEDDKHAEQSSSRPTQGPERRQG